MKVSVLMTSYNQEKYIAEAVNSILAQEVNFDCEIVIGEDASTDRTREIVLEFGRKYPDKIRVLLRGAVAAERDRARGLGGKTNFVDTLQECRGEFVALLDGDDYWTDPRKLQKQVDFLEHHPECSLCFHNAEMFYDDGSQPSTHLRPVDQKEISTVEDILNGLVPLPCTVLFRNRLLRELPESFRSVANGDWMLFALLAERGKVGYINSLMAAYRMHADGFWSRLTARQRLKGHIHTCKTIDEQLNFRYNGLISEKIAELKVHHARLCMGQCHEISRKGELRTALRLLLEATEFAPLEVLKPRLLAAVLKNGLLGILRNTGSKTEDPTRNLDSGTYPENKRIQTKPPRG